MELDIIALTHSVSKNDQYALILKEHKGLRRMSIIIGEFEAQAIAVALEQIERNRPTTHDLFRQTFEAADIQLQEVLIYDLQKDVFYARLVGKKADGKPFETDARPSDAIALAIRFPCPIFITDALLREVGTIWERANKVFTNKRDDLNAYSLEELQQLLTQVLAKEDYESASRIRDAIDRKE